MGDTNTRFALRETQASETDKIVSGLRPSYWFRADTVTLVGSNVTIARNRVGTDSLTATGVISLTTVAGQPAFNFTGTQLLQSNQSTATWTFLHDGTGCEVFFVFSPETATGLNVLLATKSMSANSRGFAFYRNTDRDVASVENGTSSVWGVTSTAGNSAVSTATYYNSFYFSASEPDAAFLTKENLIGVRSESNAPSSSQPVNRLIVGADGNGANFATAKIADIIIFKRVLTEYERVQVREYIRARYGVASTVISSNDKEILQLNPFSWFRADYYASSAGRVTAFIDKSLPGHFVSRATSINQVDNPVTSSTFNNQLVAVFSGPKGYASTLPFSSWNFLHDGRGCEIVVVCSTLTASLNSWAFGTINTGAPGIDMIINTGGSNMRIYNGSTFRDNVLVFSAQPNEPVFVDNSWFAPTSTSVSVTTRFKSNLVQTQNLTYTPSPNNSTLGFELGANRSFANTSIMTWAETILFKRILTASERLILHRYLQQRYRIY